MKIFEQALKKYKEASLAVRASLWYVICNFIQKGMSVITVPLFTRLLTKAEYGNLNVYNSWYTIISIIVALGMANGMHMQGIVKFEEKRDEFTSALLGLTSVLVLGWTAIYLAGHVFWNGLLSLNTMQMAAMLLNVWTGAVFALWANAQRVEYRYRALLLVTVISSILKPLAEIIAVYCFEDKVTAKVTATALVELLCYFGLFVFQMRKGRVFYSSETWKYALGFCVPLLPHYLSQTLLNQADRIMIKDMMGEEEAGVYGLAYSVSLVLSILVTALNQSVTPWIYEKIKEKKEKEIGRTVYLLMIFLAAVSIILILLAPEAVAIFAPDDYQDGIWSIPPVTIGIYFTFCYSTYAKFAFYYEKKSYFVIGTLSSAILNIVLNYIFIPKYGYVAAGYTTMICYMLYAFFHFVFMQRICKNCCEGRYPYDGRKLLLIQGGFTLSGLLIMLTYSYAYVRYGAVALALIIMYVKRKDVFALIGQLKKR